MWFIILSFRAEDGQRFFLPLPMFLLWPLMLLIAAVAMVVRQRMALRHRVRLLPLLLLPLQLGGLRMRVTSRDGSEFGLRVI